MLNRIYLGLVGFFVPILLQAGTNLVINEVMSRPNPFGSDRYGFQDTHPDPRINAGFVDSDWVEIYNPGDEPVDMTGLYLSDDCAFPTRWRIPAEANLVVQPKGTVVIWCAGYYHGFEECGTPERPTRCPREIAPHVAPFRLAGGGEWIGLYEADGKTLIDGFEIPFIPLNKTYGCYPDGDKTQRGYLETPTIGMVTDERASGAPNAPKINLPPVVQVRSYRGVTKDGNGETLTKIVDPSQQIRVLATIRDYDDPQPDDNDNNLKEVVLYWREAGNPNERSIAMEPILEPDRPASDFEARIPALNKNTVVEFWIRAEDKQGGVTKAYANAINELPFIVPVGGRGDISVTVVLNEILAANAGCPDYAEGELQDPSAPPCQQGGEDQELGDSGEIRKRAEDWIELYNFGDEPVPLDDLYLTNNELKPTQFPLIVAQGLSLDSIQGTSLKPHAHLLIWCDGEPQQNDEAGIHAPFTLNADSDTVYLIAYRDEDADDNPEIFKVLDYVSWSGGEARRRGPQFGPQDPDWSLGRYPDGLGSWGRMIPTQGQAVQVRSRQAYPGGPNDKLVPYLRILGFEPLVPRAGTPLTLYVHAWDEKPLPEGAVTVTYSGGDNSVPERTVTFVRDPGPEFDIYRYSATIDDSELAGKVYYEVRVTDSDGNSVRFPFMSDTTFGSIYFNGDMQDLVISEVVAANRQCPCSGEKPEGCEQGGLDPFGDADDWVEIYNPTAGAIDLSDYYLTDQPSWLTKYKFPALTIQPGERVIVWCDRETDEEGETPSPDNLHAPFLLDAGRDEVFLVKGTGERRIIDAIAWRHLPTDVAMGRDPATGEVGILLEPTLGADNSALAANAEAIQPSDPDQIKPGGVLTVTGKALDKAKKLYLVDPAETHAVELSPGVEVEVVDSWDWRNARELTWQLNGEQLSVTLPGDLAEGPHLLAVVSGESPTWHEGGTPWTRIEFRSTVGTVVPPKFIRGDSNDDGKLNIADVLAMLGYLFGGENLNCVETANANDDDKINLADPIYVLGYLFGGGPAPAAPFPECGVDPTGPAAEPCVSTFCSQ